MNEEFSDYVIPVGKKKIKLCCCKKEEDHNEAMKF